MKVHCLADDLRKIAEHNLQMEQFYSVEFGVKGLDCRYQFKIWNIESERSFVLVKEDSEIARRISEGDILSMKYYRQGSTSPSRDLVTEIKQITKEDQGRFRGHYQVDLEVLP